MKSLYTENDVRRESKVYYNPDYFPEEEEYRSSFRRDYARLVHSPAFRRLQGKTQLFPGVESDFFRNRLTHSMEVAQIAKSIAIRFNHMYDLDIDTDLVEFASLAHDLGHPPFGHSGEYALDRLMKGNGGFEGNAQTLRVLSKLEKRAVVDDEWRATQGFNIERGIDHRLGLNLTYRSLASILKYDRVLPKEKPKKEKGLIKGYYQEEEVLVKRIRSHVAPSVPQGNLKTIECSIMDLADDIAYSTHDLEDTFKAGFLKPIDMLAANRNLTEKVSQEIEKSTGLNFSPQEVQETLVEIFNTEIKLDSPDWLDFRHLVTTKSPGLSQTSMIYQASQFLASNGYYRTRLISRLIGKFIRETTLEIDQNNLILSKPKLPEAENRWIMVLKHFNYVTQIESSRLKTNEYRGAEILKVLFDTLNEKRGSCLLPEDCKMIFDHVPAEKRARIICDFIAGMTDLYVFNYYARIKSENPQSIFTF